MDLQKARKHMKLIKGVTAANQILLAFCTLAFTVAMFMVARGLWIS
jgi:hypothetical protein